MNGLTLGAKQSIMFRYPTKIIGSCEGWQVLLHITDMLFSPNQIGFLNEICRRNYGMLRFSIMIVFFFFSHIQTRTKSVKVKLLKSSYFETFVGRRKIFDMHAVSIFIFKFVRENVLFFFTLPQITQMSKNVEKNSGLFFLFCLNFFF